MRWVWSLSSETPPLSQAFRAGDYQEALVYYTRSIDYLPSSTAAHNNKALTCNKLGLYDEAIISCLEVLKLEPDNTKGNVINQLSLLTS